MIIKVRVVPRARQNKITALDDGGFKIYTAAAPADGKANEAAAAALAAHLGIPKSHVELVRGAKARDKVFATQD
jgi:uncharacterized protein YggU (UPF0235/DUF167 family)